MRGRECHIEIAAAPLFASTSIALFVLPTLFTLTPKEQQMRFFGGAEKQFALSKDALFGHK